MAHPLKFVLVGLPQSGKTTILSLLGHYNHGHRVGGLCERLGVRAVVRPANQSTINYVAQNRAGLATTGAFPASTDCVRDLAFDVNLRWAQRGETISIEVPDIPGELWQQPLSPDDPAARGLADALVDCDGIVLLVDPAGLAAGATGSHHADPVMVFQENCEKLYVALHDKLRAKRAIAPDDATLPIPVAMVLTKAERYWSDPASCRVVRRLLLSQGQPAAFGSGADCWEFPMEGEDAPVEPDQPGAIEGVICAQGIAAERLVQVMKHFFHDVSYYAVSAVGMVQRSGRWVPNIAISSRDGVFETRVADPSKLQPMNLLEPLVGLITKARKESVALEPPAPVAVRAPPSPSPVVTTPVVTGRGGQFDTAAAAFFNPPPFGPAGPPIGDGWDDLLVAPSPNDRALDLRRKASIAIVCTLLLSLCALIFFSIKGHR